VPPSGLGQDLTNEVGGDTGFGEAASGRHRRSLHVDAKGLSSGRYVTMCPAVSHAILTRHRIG